MPIPRMAQAQEHSTVLLSPVENPKPHDGAEALAGDGVPALVVRDGVALVGGAAVRAAAAHRLRLGRFSPRLVQSSACGWCASSVGWALGRLLDPPPISLRWLLGSWAS